MCPCTCVYTCVCRGEMAMFVGVCTQTWLAAALITSVWPWPLTGAIYTVRMRRVPGCESGWELSRCCLALGIRPQLWFIGSCVPSTNSPGSLVTLHAASR